ncbi:hypothetical protein H0E87_008173 [Populus deltoides]|uniref:Uncharacterized protein n=1 Tax=Populus deltoides TaxID=3696 RepID=A0A8T2YZQ7_POPDE|nr:hypothetical protein H0E87_008173 [Populus deltoides]
MENSAKTGEIGKSRNSTNVDKIDSGSTITWTTDGPRHARRFCWQDVSCRCKGAWFVRTCQCDSGDLGAIIGGSALSYMGKKLAEHGIMGAPAVQGARGSLYL